MSEVITAVQTDLGTPIDMTGVNVYTHCYEPMHDPSHIITNDNEFYITKLTNLCGAPGYLEFHFSALTSLNAFRIKAIQSDNYNYHFTHFILQYSIDDEVWKYIPHKIYVVDDIIAPVQCTEVDPPVLSQIPPGGLSPIISFPRVEAYKIRIIWWNTTHPTNDYCAIDEIYWYDTAQAVYRVYDVPLIQKEYLDSIDKTHFESSVLQNFISSMQLSLAKMMTDFANVKLCNTTGKIWNLQLNEETHKAVIDVDLTSVLGKDKRIR